MRSLFLLSISMLLAPAIASAQQLTILHNATVIDGTGSPAREHIDIAIRNGLIENVSKTIQSSGAAVIDCTGKTIIPGLISAHSHVGILLNNADPSATAYTTDNVTAALNQYERYGVTSIISLGLNRD